MYGDADAKTRAGIVVDSLDAQPKFKVEEGKGTSFMDIRETEVDDSNVKAIEKCLREWRAGTVKPIYIHFAEPTIVPKRKCGIFSFSFVATHLDQLKARRPNGNNSHFRLNKSWKL